MVKNEIVKYGNIEQYMNPMLKNSLDYVKKFSKQELDCVILISGKTGAGKSSLAQSIAMYLDPTFNEKRIAFTAEQFANKIEPMQPQQAIIYDEGHETFHTSKIMTAETRNTIALLNKIRFMRLYVLIIAPDFKRVPNDVALARSFCLIHTSMYWNKTSNCWIRGFFHYFSYKDKSRYYAALKKDATSEPGYYSTFRGTFPKVCLVDPKIYNDMKMKAVQENIKQISHKNTDSLSKGITKAFIELSNKNNQP